MVEFKGRVARAWRYSALAPAENGGYFGAVLRVPCLMCEKKSVTKRYILSLQQYLYLMNVWSREYEDGSSGSQ